VTHVDEQQLMDRVSALSALIEPAEVVRLLEVTVRALAACISLPDRQRWAATLPRPTRELFLATPYDGTQRASDVYAAVTRTEGVSARFGIEHAQAAIRALASELSPDLVQLLSRHLPPELGELLLHARDAQPNPQAPHHAAAVARPAGPIASAAGGSRHPLSEARPGAGQSGSVAGSNEHRMDQSLGSGRGPAADAESLASGRAGSKRGLSDE
jgi:uncharacterized protein (DUF2267 family)